MQATQNDRQWKVWKQSGQFWKIHPPILTWNQDTYQKNWKGLNGIILIQFLFIM